MHPPGGPTISPPSKILEESRGKTASPLTMTPHSPSNTGVNPKHKAAFGANCNAFCSKFIHQFL